MAKKYVDVDEFAEAICNFPAIDEHSANAVISLLRRQPTADVVEVKHGEWSHLGGDEWCCTNCGEVITTEGGWDKPTMKCCSNCGAKMDGRSDT